MLRRRLILDHNGDGPAEEMPSDTATYTYGEIEGLAFLVCVGKVFKLKNRDTGSYNAVQILELWLLVSVTRENVTAWDDVE